MKTIPLFALLIALPLLQSCEIRFQYGHNHGHPGWHRPYYPRPGWRHGPRYYPGWGGRIDFNTMELATATNNGMSTSDSAEMLARDYNIKVSSAQKIISLAEATNKVPAAKVLGLNDKEITALNKLEMPANAVIEKVANKLGESKSKIERVVEDFLSDVKVEQ